jgi:hypothetical protein
MSKSKWQKEYDALPEWARKMVRAAAHVHGHGGFATELVGLGRDKIGLHVLFGSREHADLWNDGLWELIDLASALTAPWPPPEPPPRERRVVNVVELIDDGNEGGGFDQPCCFGNRVGYHAVYCHNDAWPNSPRKCRRNREDYKHEDCPGFVANPDFKA